MTIHRLPPHRLVQGMAERILAEHADDEGRIGGRECLRWPLHKLREMQQKNRFDLVFVRRGGTHRCTEQQRENQCRAVDELGHPIPGLSSEQTHYIWNFNWRRTLPCVDWFTDKSKLM